MNGNSFVNFLLHTPLRGMLGDTMLITVTGCKTGRKYSLPVGFFELDGCLWVLSSRDRTWWRNLRGGAQVGLYLGGKQRQGFAEPVLDADSIKLLLGAYFRAVPLAARPLGAHLVEGILDPADADRLARERLFVRISLAPC